VAEVIGRYLFYTSFVRIGIWAAHTSTQQKSQGARAPWLFFITPCQWQPPQNQHRLDWWLALGHPDVIAHVRRFLWNRTSSVQSHEKTRPVPVSASRSKTPPVQARVLGVIWL